MPAPPGGLGELARVFLRLGAVSFGGPVAHVAMMEEDVVTRRGWLTREEFLDLVAATNLIPGPNSTELAIHIGYRRAGWTGLLVAGSCFIVPAMAFVLALAWAYAEWGRQPTAQHVLYGVKPVVIAVVAHALCRLGRSALKTPALAVLAVLALAARAVLGVHELVLLAAFAAAGALVGRPGPGARAPAPTAFFAAAGASASGVGGPASIAATGAAAAVGAPVTFGYLPLLLVFLKAGAFLFGSGYVLLAFLRSDLVERLGWLTEGQLLDAVAAGQITPGPVFATATFVGFVLAGFPGALVATVGIFLPAFVFVALSAPFLPKLRASARLGAALDGVVVASLALMAAVGWELARASIVDVYTGVIAGTSFVLLLYGRIGSAWLVLAGAFLGVAQGNWSL